MRPGLLVAALLGIGACAGAVAAGAENAWRTLPGGEFASVLRYEDTGGKAVLPGFALQQRPVTNAEYLAFVRQHPRWQRGKAPVVFAESRYLEHWAGPTTLGAKALPEQPVVMVSWFAAQAYCESIDARLPTWSEWEYAAAADETRADARSDPAWRERILAWYSVPSSRPLPAVGQSAPDVHGVQDLHGLVWEWVEDHSAMLVSGDNRDQGDPELMRFCGAGALSMDDRENYAVLMRVAMLSALEGHDTTRNLGFRCARDPTPAKGSRP